MLERYGVAGSITYLELALKVGVGWRGGRLIVPYLPWFTLYSVKGSYR